MAGINLKVGVQDKELDNLLLKIQKLQKELAKIDIHVDPEGFKELNNQLKKAMSDFEVLYMKINEAKFKPTVDVSDLVKLQDEILKMREMLETKVVMPSTPEGADINHKIADTTKELNQKTAEYLNQQAALSQEAKKLANDVLGSYGQNIKALSKIEGELKTVTAAKNLLNKSEKDGLISTQEAIKERSTLINRELQLKSSKNELQATVRNEIKQMQTAEGSIQSMALQLTRLQNTYDNLNASERNSAQGKGLLANIKQTEQEFLKLNQTMNAGKIMSSGSGFNTLGFSVQQVARELPSLTMGAQMFFLAISNNLPILSDELKKAKVNYNALVSEGKTAIPVWKQVVSSIFSWQTAMVVGITLLTMYGKEIGNWIKGLFGASKANEELAKSLDEINKSYSKAILEGSKNAQKELTNLNLLYKASQNDRKSKEERKKAVDELQKQYPAYFKNLTDEQILAGKGADAYMRLSKSIIEAARARASADKITENQSKIIDLEAKNTEVLVKREKIVANINRMNEKIKNASTGQSAATQSNFIKQQNDQLKEQDKLISDNVDQMNALNKSNERLAKNINITDLTFEVKTSDGKANKSGESVADKERKNAQELADLQIKLTDEQVKLELDRQQKVLDIQNEGLEKQLAQNNLNYDKQLQQISEFEAEKLKAQQEAIQKYGKDKLPEELSTANINNQSAQMRSSAFADWQRANNKAIEDNINAERTAWNDYFIEFGNYQEKRKAIIEKYNQEIAQAIQDGEKAALENKKQNALDELDNSVKNSAKLMAQLFADSSLKSVTEIQAVIDKAEMLMNYLAAVKDEQGNATIDGKNVSKKDILNLGISESELKKLELSAQEVEALRNVINKLKGDLGGRSPFEQFKSQVKDAYDLIKKGGKENIGQGISGIGGAIQGITPELKEFGNSMGQIFGEQTGDDINTIVDLLGNTAQVGQGVGKIMAGDVVGGIKDVVTGIGNIFAMGSEAEERHREALKIINESVKSQEHAYQLALRLKSLEYEKGNTIFGDDPYGKAINAAKEYKDAIEDLKASLKGDGKLKQSGLFAFFNKVPKTSDYAALQNIDIVTGHEKTGLFGWGKGKDTYSGILSVYPELIDSQGKFNAELAKTILAERTMSDSSKATLQQMIDNAEAIEEAYSVMKDYLTDIFGDLGDSMTDALVDAFQNGTDAAEAFYDSASGMMENLVKDMINSAILGPVIQKATEEAMKIMEDTSLSEKERMDKLMSVVDNLMENGLAASDQAKDLYDYANKIWEDKTGETLFDKGSSQTPSSGGFETMSQDTATALEGRFNSMQIRLITIDENVARIAQWNQPVSEKFNFDTIVMPLGVLSQSSLRIERMMEENRNIAISSYYELKDINKQTKELYPIRSAIDSMNSKLDNI